MEEEKSKDELQNELQTKSQEKTQIKTKGQSFWELARFALISLAIVIQVRIYIAQPFIVSGSSMVPTFEDGQYLIVDESGSRL